MGDDKVAAEIAAWRTACEDATVWGDEMRQVMLAAVLGTDRTGRNAAMGRILREWAVEQIEACPGAENYLEISMDYTESTPGLIVLVHIQRDGGETPGNRATRLQAERDAAVARAESAEARAAAGGAALMEVAHAVERTRRAVLAEVIDLLDTRAVQRSAQVDVAQEAGGAWQVVAGKGSELMAVADLLRARLRTGPEVATG